MKKRVIILLMIIAIVNLYSEEYKDIKGIKWSEGSSEIILRKDENIKEKTDKAYENAKIKAVKKIYPFEIEGNGIRSNIVQEYIAERAKINIVREFPGEWDREVRDDGTILFRVKLKVGVKEREKNSENNLFLKIECNKDNYIEGEKIKFKVYSGEKGYVALFILYDDKRAGKINFGKSNMKGAVEKVKESDMSGEWGMTQALIPPGTSQEQVIYAVYTKEYFDIEKKYGKSIITTAELAKEINELKEAAESAVIYKVIKREK